MRQISFGPQVCGRFDEGAAREWLVPDGRGGYAMGTVSGLRTTVLKLAEAARSTAGSAARAHPAALASFAHRFPTPDGLLHEYGLGAISETAEGDAPHNATGCPFQAWSVAESLRVRRR